jgi:heptosyltransferase-2
MQNKVLIIGPSWVGDMVLAQSLFKVLKQQDNSLQIDVAAPAWTLPILHRMPEVHKGIGLPFTHGKLNLLARIKLGLSWRKQAYQQVIVLPNSFKSAISPLFANIPKRTGFIGEFRYPLLNDARKLDKQALPRTVDRFVSLALKPKQTISNIPNPSLTVDPINLAKLIEHYQLNPNQKILGLCPGAEFGEAKRWPAEYYAEVANFALSAGWQVFLFGSKKDQPVASNINQLCANQCQDFTGKTSLGDAIDLMSLCTSIISNDSGLMHIAAALDKKLIAIYGSSDPTHTPPMSSKAVIEYLGLACSPCFKRSCPLGHLNCLKGIKPQNILL